jgi:hypothetical protein
MIDSTSSNLADLLAQKEMFLRQIRTEYASHMLEVERSGSKLARVPDHFSICAKVPRTDRDFVCA